MLNELEIDQLQKILNDEILLKIVKKVFYNTIRNNLPDANDKDNNELIGQKYRAYKEAEGIVDTAFKDLSSYLKVGTEKNTEFNKGR